MKRLIALFMIVFLLCSCSEENSIENEKKSTASSGVWLTFSEINQMLTSETGFQTELEAVVNNCRNLKIENIYIHVRSYCDSLFKSEYFPLINEAEGYDYDIFEYMLDSFHKSGIKVHAWINPYRVLTSSNDIEQLDQNSPAYKWIKDGDPKNDVNVCFFDGIYLNPAELEVQGLILNGIKEIISKYDVDGIHFDDYFYPTTDTAFDEISYNAYCEATEKPFSLENWRRANVNALISGCYNAIKYKNENILFTVSPSASIEKNHNEMFADVNSWVEGGYVDCIIPQLYFGFEYPQSEFKFENILSDWKKIAEINSEVSLLIGLAGYKIGTDSVHDSAEWQSKDDIIARQAEICYTDSSIDGYVIFSYSSLFSADELNTKQRENLTQIVEKYSLSEGVSP